MPADKTRFETAAWFAATAGFGYGPSVAGVIVSAAFSPLPITAEIVDEAVLSLTTGIAHASLKGRAERIRSRADEILHRRTDADEAWLVESSAAIVNLVNAGDDAAMVGWSLDRLRAIGWAPALDRIAARLRNAFASNLPPVDHPISRQAQRLLAALSVEPSPGQ